MTPSAVTRNLPRRRIQFTSGWRLVNWGEILAYRDLFRFLVLRDIRIQYSQTVLGLGWAVIRPVFSMIVFSIVFGSLAEVPSDGAPYPIFAFAALVPWTYFSSALNDSTQSLVSSIDLFTKVYFPRLFIPLTPVVAKLLDFIIAFVLLVILMFWYGLPARIEILLVPALVLLMCLTAAGLGMWLSALAVRYRDVRQAMPFIIQILMYAAPVVWPSSLIRDKFGEAAFLLYGLYPMAGVIEGFRAALLGTVPVPWNLLLVGTTSTLLIFFSGSLFFRRTEHSFADVA